MPEGETGPRTRAEGADDMALTEDGLLGGRVRLLQPRRGYRAGLDAALLAAAIEAKPGDRVVEAGCGAGAALLQVAIRLPRLLLMGVERDPEALALARSNVLLNRCEHRVETLEGDVGAGFDRIGRPRFDAAFCNPPFFDDPSALRGPAPERRGAWLADAGLGAWTGFLLDAVREGGSVTIIHRADRLADLLQQLGDRAGSLRIRPVQPFADAPAKRVLVRAIKGGRAPLVLLPALVLHEREGARHTAAADAILRGEAVLAWS